MSKLKKQLITVALSVLMVFAFIGMAVVSLPVAKAATAEEVSARVKVVTDKAGTDEDGKLTEEKVLAMLDAGIDYTTAAAIEYIFNAGNVTVSDADKANFDFIKGYFYDAVKIVAGVKNLTNDYVLNEMTYDEKATVDEWIATYNTTEARTRTIQVQATDDNGDPVWETDDNGDYVLDENNEKIPVIVDAEETYTVPYRFKGFIDVLTNNLELLYEEGYGAYARFQVLEGLIATANAKIDEIKEYVGITGTESQETVDTLAASYETLVAAKNALDAIYAPREFEDAILKNKVKKDVSYINEYDFYTDAWARYNDFIAEATKLNGKILDLYNGSYADGNRLSIEGDVEEYEETYAGFDNELKTRVQVEVEDLDEQKTYLDLLVEMREGITEEKKEIEYVWGQIQSIGAVHYTADSKVLIDNARSGRWDGEYFVKLDDEGNVVYYQKKDDEGNLVFEQKVDENNNPVYEKKTVYYVADDEGNATTTVADEQTAGEGRVAVEENDWTKPVWDETKPVWDYDSPVYTDEKILFGGYDRLREDSKAAIEEVEDHILTIKYYDLEFTIDYSVLENAEKTYNNFDKLYKTATAAIDKAVNSTDFINDFAKAQAAYNALTNPEIGEWTNFRTALRTAFETPVEYNNKEVANYYDLYAEMDKVNTQNLRNAEEADAKIRLLGTNVDELKVYLTYDYKELYDDAVAAYEAAAEGGYASYVTQKAILDKAIELYTAAEEKADAWVEDEVKLILNEKQGSNQVIDEEGNVTTETYVYYVVNEVLTNKVFKDFLTAYATEVELRAYVPQSDTGYDWSNIIQEYLDAYEFVEIYKNFANEYLTAIKVAVDTLNENSREVAHEAVYENRTGTRTVTVTKRAEKDDEGNAKVDAEGNYVWAAEDATDYVEVQVEQQEEYQYQVKVKDTEYKDKITLALKTDIATVLNLIKAASYEDGVDVLAQNEAIMGANFTIDYALYTKRVADYAEYVNTLNGYIVSILELARPDEKGEGTAITDEMYADAVKAFIMAVVNRFISDEDAKITELVVVPDDEWVDEEIEDEEGEGDIAQKIKKSEFDKYYDLFVNVLKTGEYDDDETYAAAYLPNLIGNTPYLKLYIDELVAAVEVTPISAVAVTKDEDMYIVDIGAVNEIVEELTALAAADAQIADYVAGLETIVNNIVANSNKTVKYVNNLMADSAEKTTAELAPIKATYDKLHESQQKSELLTNKDTFLRNLDMAEFRDNAREMEGQIKAIENAIKGDNEEYDVESIYAQLAAIKEELAALEEKGYDDTELTERVEALETAVAELKAADEEIKGDITALEDRVAALEDAVSKLHNYDDTEVKADIEEIKTDVAALKEFVENYEEYDDAEVKASIEALEEKMTAVETDIAALKAADQAHDEKIAALDAAVKALQEFVDGYEEYDDTELKAAVKALQDWVDGYKAYDDAEVKAAVKALQDWVDAYKAYDDAEVKASIEALEDAVSKLHNYDDSELAAKVAELEAALKKANDDRAAADKAHDDAISGVQGYCTGLLIALIVTFLVAACGVVLVFLFKKKA